MYSYGISEGAALTQKIDSTGASFGAAFQSGGATCILLGNDATQALADYGYFAGDTARELIINYTK